MMPDPKDDKPVGDNALSDLNDQNRGEGAESTPNPDDKDPEEVKPSDVA